MIELNLIDAVTQSAPSTSMPVKPVAASTLKKGKRPLMLWVAAAVVMAILFCILKIAGVPHVLEGVLPSPLVAALELKIRAVPGLRWNLAVLARRPRPVVRLRVAVQKKRPLPYADPS